MNLFLRLAVASLPCWMGLSVADEQPWQGFRGANGQGHLAGTNLPSKLSPDQDVVWKVATKGRGWSSPIVHRNHILLTSADDGARSLRLVMHDFATGAEVSNIEVFSVSKPLDVNAKNSHASPTPCVEGDFVYCHFGAMGTACVNISDPKQPTVVWRRNDLVIDHKEGPGGSPIIYKNKLIFNCDGQDLQYVVALDKATGKTIWKTDRTGDLGTNGDLRKAYATPMIYQHQGKDVLLSPGAQQILAYDPNDGKELWKIRHKGFSNVPLALLDDEYIYLTNGYSQPEMWAIKPFGEGDVTDKNVVWRHKDGAPGSSSPILVDGLLYFASDRGILTCLEAKTGKPVWKQRLPGNYSASPILADGKIYFCSEQGDTTVIKPGRTFETLGSGQFHDGLALPPPPKKDPKQAAQDQRMFSKGKGQIMATPAVIGSAIILRTGTHLYRIEKK